MPLPRTLPGDAMATSVYNRQPMELDVLADRIGRVIRAYRLAQGMSLGDLARASGLSKTILARIESGAGNPSIETLWRVSRALNLPLGALLAEDEAPRVRAIPARTGEALAADAGMAAWLIHADGREHRSEVYEIAFEAGVEQRTDAHLPGTEEVIVCVEGRLRAGPARGSGGARAGRRRLVRGGRGPRLHRAGGRPRAVLDAVPDRGGAGMRPGSGAAQPVIAGVVASLVGFASTFALVLAGLRAVGASEAEAASGLATLCFTMAVVAVWLGVRYRQPLAIAWSTPGAALLVAGGEVPGGYPAALGAFAVTGVLIVVAGLWRTLGRWVRGDPGRAGQRDAGGRPPPGLPGAGRGRGRPSRPGAAGDRHLGGADAGGPPLGGARRARRRGDRDRRRPARGHRAPSRCCPPSRSRRPRSTPARCSASPSRCSWSRWPRRTSPASPCSSPSATARRSRPRS